MAACDQSESSFEDEKLGHGVFTYAVLEALGQKFRAADLFFEILLGSAFLHADEWVILGVKPTDIGGPGFAVDTPGDASVIRQIVLMNRFR